MALPEAEGGTTHTMTAWKVGGKAFAWQRPLGKKDRSELKSAIDPDQPILAVRVPDLDTKELLVENEPEIFFTIPHFHGFPAVLIQLEQIDDDRLQEVLTEGWLAKAPKRLAKAFLEAR